MRKIALKRAWELADEEAKAGKPMMLGDFGKFIKQGYSEVRKAQERCPFPGSEGIKEEKKEEKKEE